MTKAGADHSNHEYRIIKEALVFVKTPVFGVDFLRTGVYKGFNPDLYLTPRYSPETRNY